MRNVGSMVSPEWNCCPQESGEPFHCRVVQEEEVTVSELEGRKEKATKVGRDISRGITFVRETESLSWDGFPLSFRRGLHSFFQLELLQFTESTGIDLLNWISRGLLGNTSGLILMRMRRGETPDANENMD